MLIGRIIIMFFFPFLSSVAISHGHHRPAQPVRPLRQHGGVNADKGARKKRARNNENATGRLEKKGDGWQGLAEIVPDLMILSINNVTV